MAGWLADHKALHSRLSDVIHFESQGPDCCSHHAIMMVDQFDGLSVQMERPLVVEKLHCVLVQFQADGLQQRDVVTKNFFVVKVKVHANHCVDMVVAEHVEDGCFALYVLHNAVDYWLLWPR